MIPVEAHLVLNHVPFVGSIFGLIFFVAGLRRSSDPALRAGLRIFLAMAIAAVAVAGSGLASAKALAEASWLASDALAKHRSSGIVALLFAAALGGVSGAALLVSRSTRVPAWARNSVLLLAMGSVAASSWAGYLGGSLRHSELERARAQTAVEDMPGTAAPSDHESTSWNRAIRVSSPGRVVASFAAANT